MKTGKERNDLETALSAINECLKAPLVLEDADTRKRKLEQERALVERQEQQYSAPSYEIRVSRQFTL